MDTCEYFPDLQTGRLFLRAVTNRDADAFYILRSNPDVVKYTGAPCYHAYDQAVDYVARLQSDFVRGDAFCWGITFTLTAPLIGSVCLWNPSEDKKVYDIGYELLPVYQNRGYVKEAVGAVLEYAFLHLELDMVRADPRMDNLPSVELLKRLGFHLLREQRGEGGFVHGLFQISRESYLATLQRVTKWYGS